jgi:signal transduction histidine kinase
MHSAIFDDASGSDAFILVDDRGQCTGMTSTALKLLEAWGVEPESQTLAELLPRAFDAAACERWQRALRERASAELGEYRTSDGRRFLCRCAPLGSGTLLYLLSLAARGDAASTALDQRRRTDDVVAVLAHELRNPLSAVCFSASLLRRLEPGPGRERMLDLLERQVAHCSQIVDGLFDASYVLSGRLQIRPARIEVARLVEDAVVCLRPRAERKGLRLEVDVPAGLVAHADPVRLQQVLVNLLTNSIANTEPGGGVAVAARASGDDIEIRVSDTGCGIARDRLEHLFERSLTTWGDSSEAHLGIGLSLVRAIAELHGGSVAVASPGVGHGAEFVVRFPARAVGSAEPVRERSSGSQNPTESSRL